MKAIVLLAASLLNAVAWAQTHGTVQAVRQATFEPATLARLSASGVDLNASGANGHNALTSLVVEQPMAIRAIRRGTEPSVTDIPAPDNVARVKALLAAGADPNFKYRGETPLMLAIVTPGRGAFEDALLDAGGRIEFAGTIPAPDAKDPAGGPYGSHLGVLTGMTVGPLTWASRHERPRVALRLLERDRKVEATDRYVLYFAAVARQWDLVVGALPYIREVDAGDRVGVTPLMLAARAGQADVVRALLSAGAQVNTRTVRVWVENDNSIAAFISGHRRQPFLVGGYTALRVAKERGHTEVAQLLSAAGGRE